jgi:radical SAM protein with 4Fe4S-binding SPASM domain
MSIGRAAIGPRLVSLEVTHHCNLNCVFCESHGRCLAQPITARRAYAGGRRTMGLETVARLARDLRRGGTPLVELSGKGEPTGHPEFEQILKAIKGAGLDCSLITNGTMAAPGLAAAIVESGLDRMTVSLNAGCHESHTRVTGHDAWERAIAFVHDVLDARRRRGARRPWIRLSHVVCKENLADMENMVRLGCDLRVEEVFWCVMGELPETRHLQLDAGDVTSIPPRIQELGEQLAGAGVAHNLRNFAAELPLRLSAGSPQENPLQRHLPCYEAWRFCVIGPDGAIVPCCYCEEEILGNLVEEGFPAVWRGARYRDLRRRMLGMPKTGRPICRECFTTCNRARENLRIHKRLHPLWKMPPGLA